MEYSVKSGYWAVTHDLLEDEPINPPVGSIVIKDKIWKLTILPKIKQFLWKVVSGAIPTYVQLCTRGINIDPVCQRCCLDEETINHALFLCPHANAVWRCFDLSVAQLFTDSLEDNFEVLFSLQHSNDHSHIRRLSFWVVWFIWKSRNEFLFQHRNSHPVEDFQRASRAHNEWNDNQGVDRQSLHIRPKSSQWSPPPSGWLKCNFDSSYDKENRVAGVGWIIRCDEGRFLCAGLSRCVNVESPLQGEALGFLLALQQVWIRGLRSVWFEGDSLQLSTIINNKVAQNVELGNVLHDIRHWISLLPACSIDSVNRERNSAADALSKEAKNIHVDYMYLSSPPLCLIPFLYWPYTV